MPKKFSNPADVHLAVVGLGYVGLPLAVEFGKKRPVIGFDINERRIAALKAGHDHTLEVEDDELARAAQLSYTAEREELGKANVFIVTVPTPIDEYKQPDLTPLVKASETIGAVLKRGDIVIYESTVYPGATEEDCVPVLERVSGLKFNQDFYAGYSPERINPGDKAHRVNTIKKVTSGSTPEVAELVDQLYNEIITAGTHKASSIRVAEAAKVIENTQRDVNIALINELALIFNKMGIDTEAVLQAAGTKWNFLPFRPGLVGGHCIGVDPYYLTHKAQAIGYHPEIILAGRRLNDSMGGYVVSQLVKAMAKRRIHVGGRARAADGPDVQGKLPRPAQHARGGHRARAGRVPRRRGRVRPVGGPGRGRARVRHHAGRQAGRRGVRRDHPGGVAPPVRRDGRRGDPQVRARPSTSCTT
ncbi:polysaccharide biosynthesis protein [Bordetella pertussis]|nr:polysaccharide biosynthesis protein [Bordetella pertussis]